MVSDPDKLLRLWTALQYIHNKNRVIRNLSIYKKSAKQRSNDNLRWAYSQSSPGRLKTREWKTRHQTAGVENAGVENAGVWKVWKAKISKMCFWLYWLSASCGDIITCLAYVGL